MKAVDKDEAFGPAPEPEKKPKKPTPRKPASGGGGARSIEQDIAAILVYSNLMLAPVLKGDALDEVEIMALARSIDRQAKNSPRFRAAVDKMLTAMGGTGLLGVSLMIVGRRAARHGMIAREWDLNLGIALQVSQMSQSQQVAFMEEQMAAVQAAMDAEAAHGQNGFSTPSQPGPVPAEAPRTD